MLAGDHHESAVVSVDVDGDLHSDTRVPLVSSLVGERQMFVNHPQVTDFLHCEQAARLAEVTASCSTAKIELVRSIGADGVVDYTREDFAAGSERWDVIFAVNGFRPISDFRRVLTPAGL